ncbi:MAG: hypothetical protein HYS22_06815 [Deltaproteobacteria bacterium]|nr:hypothetical protein [Deltaproteobacteria bacterium]
MKQFPWVYYLGLISSIILPFFNFPLMIRILRRKSADDLSLIWLLGVFTCLLLMEPAALASPDPLFRLFGTLNLLFFSGVTFLVIYFRWIKKK